MRLWQIGYDQGKLNKETTHGSVTSTKIGKSKIRQINVTTVR